MPFVRHHLKADKHHEIRGNASIMDNADSSISARDYSAQGRNERVTSKDRLERLEEGVLTLAQRREETPDPAVCLGTRASAEAARHLLLYLEHTQILLGLVVIEGDGEVL
jgi:hypothetical protein